MEAKKIGIGQRIGLLTVAEATDQRRDHRIVWRCQCDCGGETLVDTARLRRGTVQDCGCTDRLPGKAIDLRGRRFGKLLAVEATDMRSRKSHIIWKCLCDCGNTAYVPSGQLTDGATKSCGCLWKPPIKDYVGQRFGQLTVLAYEGREKGNHLWRCRCDCGAETIVRQTQLQSGKTKSCGCLLRSTIVENMRLVDGTSITLLENTKNRLLKSNTSGYNGVYQNRKSRKWQAQITFKGKTYFLGSYDRIEDAVKARMRGEEMYEEFLRQHQEQETEGK